MPGFLHSCVLSFVSVGAGLKGPYYCHAWLTGSRVLTFLGDRRLSAVMGTWVCALAETPAGLGLQDSKGHGLEAQRQLVTQSGAILD